MIFKSAFVIVPRNQGEVQLYLNSNSKPMSQVYSRVIKISGNTGTIFDGMASFLVARGFVINNADRPNTMVADRGILRPTNKIEKYPHTLVIAMHPTGDALSLSFIYVMSDFWHYTAGDRLFFNNEIDLFVRGLVADGAKVAAGEAVPSVIDNGYIEELRQLAKLRGEGVLSGEEFDQKKKLLLGL